MPLPATERCLVAVLWPPAYSPAQFSKMIGKSVPTLQRWDREGTFIANRNSKNRRYYTHDQYLEYIGAKASDEKGRIVVYSRVSSSSQKNDLENQTSSLEMFYAAASRRSYGKNSNRRLSTWTKGIIAEALETISQRRGSSLRMVNEAYTWQMDSQDSDLLTGKRIGVSFTVKTGM